MLDRDTVQGIAQKLEEAEANATQIAQVSETFPDMEMADAYAIQNAWRELKIASGRVIRGHKIGLTSRAMQQAVAHLSDENNLILHDFEPKLLRSIADSAKMKSAQEEMQRLRKYAINTAKWTKNNPNWPQNNPLKRFII